MGKKSREKGGKKKSRGKKSRLEFPDPPCTPKPPGPPPPVRPPGPSDTTWPDLETLFKIFRRK